MSLKTVDEILNFSKIELGVWGEVSVQVFTSYLVLVKRQDSARAKFYNCLLILKDDMLKRSELQ